MTAAESGHVRVVRFEDSKSVNIYAEGPISKMRHSKSNPCIIGTGGLENELKLWDLNTGAKTFTAKNVSLIMCNLAFYFPCSIILHFSVVPGSTGLASASCESVGH